MVKATFRWTLLLASLFALGPLAYAATRHLRDVDHGPAATLLVGDSMGAGVLAGLIVFAIAAVAGAIGARFFAFHTGLTAAGFVVAWGAWGLGTLDAIARRARDASDLPVLAIEGLLVMGVAIALTWGLERLAPKAPPASESPLNPADTKGIAAGAIAAAVVGGLAIWIFCMTTYKGQTVACAALAGILGAAAAQLVAAFLGSSIGALPPMLGLAALALVGPLAARVMHDAQFVQAVFNAGVLPLAKPLSLDWAAGALIGVPIGLSWAGSMLERKPVTT